ncbi:hypothetical protein JXA12_05735 [Candidatus Woesearchaeota archaeon]|nr:hypothetical protein [Candidatus Woesearchaeota archaeon]
MTQALLKEMTDKKIAYLLSKHSIKDVDVYTVIKEFFKEYLHANYEFTFDELTEELKKVYIEKQVKESLFRLLKDFSTIEYKDEEIPQEVLRNILTSFSKLVNSLIKKEMQRGGLFSRLFGSKEVPAAKDSPQLTPQEEREVRKDALPETAPELPASSLEDAPRPSPSPATMEGQFEVPSLEPSPEEQGAPQEPLAEEQRPAGEQPAAPDTGKAPSWVEPQESPEALRPSMADDWSSDDHANHDAPSVSDDEPLPFEQQASTEPSGTTQPSPAQDAVPEAPSQEETQASGDQPTTEPVLEEQAPPQEAIPDTDTVPSTPPEDAVPEAPLQEQAQATIPEHAPAQQYSSPDDNDSEVYFGDDEELSDDLNRLAEQLDDVIKEDDSSSAAARHPPDLDHLIVGVEHLIAQQDLAGAQDAYRQLLEHYDALPEHDKHRYYGKLQELYAKLQ